MPIYEYHCPEHGQFMKHLKEPADPVPCDQCGEISKRVWGMAPVIFRPEGYSLPMDHPDFWKGVKDREDRYTWQQ